MPECAKAHLQQSRIAVGELQSHRVPAFQGLGEKGEMEGLEEGWLGRGKGKDEGREGGAPPNKNLPLHH